MEQTGRILQAIFDSSDDAWFFVTSDFKINFFNTKASQNSKGFNGKPLTSGDSILDLIRDTENDRDGFIESFGRAASGELVKEEKSITHSLQVRWYRLKYTPVYREENLLGVSILVEDISYQKALEEEQRLNQEQIIALSKKQEEFVDIASHELKTPLTTLKATFQIIEKHLMKGATYEEIKKHFERTSLSIEKLNLLIQDLLNVNKISNGSLSLYKSEFKMAELVNSCCYHISLAGTHTIAVEGNLELSVFADKNKIEQVLVNLLNNAVKYAVGSSEIQVTIASNESYAKVLVKDFGPGVPQDKIAHLFERYYQVENGYHRSGMGLGLYIAEGIIKQHEGTIGVDSKVGEGSTFWFTLPL